MNKKKFRVWDTLTKTFLTDKSHFQGHYVIGLNGSFHNLHNGGGDLEYILQQFTGLKDKNNKEIFEGDIVKLHDSRNGDRVGDVYFGSGAFIVRHIASLFYGAKDGMCEDYEVVGNIFQNPELLK